MYTVYCILYTVLKRPTLRLLFPPSLRSVGFPRRYRPGALAAREVR